MDPIDRHEFISRVDPVESAKWLLGKLIWTRDGDIITAAQITETEGYDASDRPCHAYRYRRTKRNEVMFEEGGLAYVYRCYGLFSLMNVVFGPEGEPTAVLIRAAVPVVNAETMLARRQSHQKRLAALPTHKLMTGPGVLTQALGVTQADYGAKLFQNDSKIWISECPKGCDEWMQVAHRIPSKDTNQIMVKSTPRIGVGGDPKEWRFLITQKDIFDAVMLVYN